MKKVLMTFSYFLLSFWMTPSAVFGQDKNGATILSINIENPLRVATVQDATSSFLDIAIRIAIPFIVIFFMWAGLKFILALGNPEKIGQAKKMFWYTIIGTLLILGAWVITTAITGTINSIMNDSPKESNSEPSTNNNTQPPLVDTATNNTANGVLFVGGSYIEENPEYAYTGQLTCSNPPSKSLSRTSQRLLTYLKPSVAFAQSADDQLAITDAISIAEQVREARCWLMTWYINRQISNPDIVLTDAHAEKLIKNLQSVPFKIIDVDTNPSLSPCPGAYACSVWINKINNYEIIVNYQKKNIVRLQQVTLYIHELTHVAEANGRDIPTTQTARIEQLFPDNLVRGYFEDTFNAVSEAEYNVDPIKFFYCYIYQGVNNKCYRITKTPTSSTTSPSPYTITTVPNTYYSKTELTARVMELRYQYDSQPSENVQWYAPYLTVLNGRPSDNIDKFALYKITSDTHQEYVHTKSNLDADQVITHIGFAAVLGDMYGCRNSIRADNKPGQLICSFGKRTNPSGTPTEYLYASKIDAANEIEKMVARKIQSLFNETL